MIPSSGLREVARHHWSENAVVAESAAQVEVGRDHIVWDEDGSHIDGSLRVRASLDEIPNPSWASKQAWRMEKSLKSCSAPTPRLKLTLGCKHTLGAAMWCGLCVWKGYRLRVAYPLRRAQLGRSSVRESRHLHLLSYEDQSTWMEWLERPVDNWQLAIESLKFTKWSVYLSSRHNHRTRQGPCPHCTDHRVGVRAVRAREAQATQR